MTRARLTPEEKEDRKRVQRERHNAKRKEAYHGDPERRSAILDQSRRSYQSANGVVPFDCRSNLSKLDQLGEVRPIMDEYKGPAQALTFTSQELSEVIGQYIDVLYRWQRKRIIPKPVIRAAIATRQGAAPTPQYVYLREEVEAIVNAVGEHKSRYTQLREAHTETIGAVWTGVATARTTLGLPADVEEA